MPRQRVRRNPHNSSLGPDVGGNTAVVQASLLASLTAATISHSRWAIIGVPFTAVGSAYGPAWAVAAAAAHVLIIVVLKERSPYPVEAIMAGLLGGCVISHRTTAATIFGAIVTAAIIVSAVVLEWNFWVVAIPAVVAGIAVGVILNSSKHIVRKSKNSNINVDLERQLPPDYKTATLGSEKRNQFM